MGDRGGRAGFSAYITDISGGSDSDIAASFAIGYVSGCAYQASGAYFQGNPVGGVIAHGVIAGAVSVATGGKFASGFISGAFSKFVTINTDTAFDNTPGNFDPGHFAVTVIAGGVGSVLGGGKFANGALSGAMGYILNWTSKPGAKVHQRATRKVLGDELSERELEILDSAQEFADGERFQTPGFSYRHALRNGKTGQTVDQAEQLAVGFLYKQFSRAIALRDTLPDQSLREFGIALHTLQDSTSPAHHGFQPWGNGSPAMHVAQEYRNPGVGSNLYRITRDAYRWYQSGQLPPGNVFSRYGSD